MPRPLHIIRFLTLIAAVVGLAAQASARTEDLRWSDSNGGANGYVVHVGTESRNYATQVDAGVPGQDASGAFVFSVQVPDDDVVYIAITSYNGSGVQSAYSNERIRVPAGWEPPQGSTGGGNDPTDSGSGSGSGGDSGSDSGSGGDAGSGSGGGTTLPPQTSWKINAGGADFTDAAGNTWIGDDVLISAGNTASANVTVGGNVAQELYGTERYMQPGSNMVYAIPVNDGTYEVTLHFSEVWSGISGPGQRTFDVTAEGQNILADYDIYADVGFAQPAAKTFTVNVTGGALEIVFSHGVQNPKVCGIEVDIDDETISVGQPGKPQIVLP